MVCFIEEPDRAQGNAGFRSNTEQSPNSEQGPKPVTGNSDATSEPQPMTARDLQNLFYSTEVATLYLDTEFRIWFFTPATISLFDIAPADLGKPLAGVRSLTHDNLLMDDANQVLSRLSPIEREIKAASGAWFTRRILPYRADNGGVAGVVITFVDITERRHIGDALILAKRQAELATAAKSRFLAGASHDLRQPLQTLALLQGLLAKTVEGERVQKLVARLDDTLGAMSGMLNTLLDINQIEAGTVLADTATFPVDEVFARLKEEFAYHAQAQGLSCARCPANSPSTAIPGCWSR